MHNVREHSGALALLVYESELKGTLFLRGRCFSHLYPNEKNAGAYGDPARKQLDDSIPDRKKNVTLLCCKNRTYKVPVVQWLSTLSCVCSVTVRIAVTYTQNK